MEGRRIKKETRLNLETSCKPAVPLKLHKNVPLYGLHQAPCRYVAITRDIYCTASAVGSGLRLRRDRFKVSYLLAPTAGSLQ